jgi:PTS system glucose-specific IIC component
VRWNLKTPGREDEETTAAATSGAGDSLAARVVSAFGGAANIRSLDACITRLRVELNDVTLASADTLRSLGAAGVLQVGGGMQAVFGTRSENLKTDIEEYLRASGAPTIEGPAGLPAAVSGSPVVAEASPAVSDEHRSLAAAILAALGGSENIASVEPCALTRLRVELREPRGLDEAALEAAGASGMLRVSESVIHVVLGERATAVAAAIVAAIDDELRAPAPL